MVTYLETVALNLSDITSPLKNDKVKDQITSSPSPVLAYFDPRKVTSLHCGASKYGLCAALVQEGKPIAFASKSLAQSEVQFAQIEKELLTILFGFKRFHQYIYG